MLSPHHPKSYFNFYFAWLYHNPGVEVPSFEEFVEFATVPYENTQMSPLELVDTFPEAHDTIYSLKNECEEDFLRLNDILRTIFSVIYSHPYYTDDERIFQDLLVSNEYIKIADNLRSNIYRLRSLVAIIDNRNNPVTGPVNPERIARAKQVPISLFIKIPKSGFVVCPFHKEKTASFKVYKNNRFKCFGCNQFGDAIDFIMKRDGLSFIGAVQFLTRDGS